MKMKEKKMMRRKDEKGIVALIFPRFFLYLHYDFCIMIIAFNIHYATLWGQSIEVVVTYHASNGKNRLYRLPMNTEDGELWTLETAVMESRQRNITAVSYYYQLVDAANKVIRVEWDKTPRLFAYDSSMSYVFHDLWRDTPLHEHLYSPAVRVTAGLPELSSVKSVKMPLFRKTALFHVAASQIKAGQSVAILGNHPSLGDWNPARYLRMTHVGGADWQLTVNIDNFRWPLEYKYVVVDDTTKNVCQWEEGNNRVIDSPRDVEGTVHVFFGDSLRISGVHWKAAGVAVPLFSLRSERSFGVGDFGDLYQLVGWAHQVGLKVIQLLPLCDTTATHGWTDSHPYNAISVFALHPQYLDLSALPALADEGKMSSFNRKRRELNALSYTDYPAVQRVKEAFIDEAFKEQGAKLLASEECRVFMRDNGEWLIPYAAFSILRERYHTARFHDWGDYADYSRKKAEQLVQEEKTSFDRICFVQFLLYSQLRRVTDEAHRKGVAIMGDLPIGIYRDSVDVWTAPQWFDEQVQMGTMPDNNQPDGQNWGFPGYRWDATDDGVKGGVVEWFHRRLNAMQRFFDILRIDHVAGWFRIWLIPQHAVKAVLGHFAPSLPLGEEEIAQYGLPFRKRLLTQPFINDAIIDKLFGLHAEYVRQQYLTRLPYGLYALKNEVNTQVKVRDLFGDKNDENSLWIRDGLYRLLANVLFVEDDTQPGMYHPRIMAYREPVYDVLSTEEKEAYMRIYNHFFFERHRDYWQYAAKRKIGDVFAHSTLLLCAENIGAMPDGYEQVLDRMRILSMVMQSMPQRYDGEFAHIEAWPYLSLCTTSTHDMPTLRMWWEENGGRTQRYYATMLQKQGRAPKQLPAHIAEEMVARHLYSPCMLCILPVQDWLAIDGQYRTKDSSDERINAPYDPYNQWRYRMALSVDAMAKAETLNKKIKVMVTRSGR